tara:strand:- start:416 stop:550 length:135 start_codon:yes stop_codon:yes gene_type:complete
MPAWHLFLQFNCIEGRKQDALFIYFLFSNGQAKKILILLFYYEN